MDTSRKDKPTLVKTFHRNVSTKFISVLTALAVAITQRGLQELNNLQQGELLLGASQTIGSYWLPYFISKFKQQYPGIRIDCTLGNTQDSSAFS